MLFSCKVAFAHSVFDYVLFTTTNVPINLLAFHSTNYPKVKFNINFDIALNDILATCSACTCSACTCSACTCTCNS